MKMVDYFSSPHPQGFALSTAAFIEKIGRDRIVRMIARERLLDMKRRLDEIAHRKECDYGSISTGPSTDGG